MHFNVIKVLKNIDMRSVWKKKFWLYFMVGTLLWVAFRYWSRTEIELKVLHSDGTLIVWATPIMEGYEQTRYCGFYKCTFSNIAEKRKRAKILMFYGSKISVEDLPLPRPPGQIWALLHEESPRNIPYLLYKDFLHHFNLTSTFSRYSDFPLTTYYLPSLSELTSPEFLVPIGEKSRLRKKDKLAPIVFLQSNCDTMSSRDTYVKELMEYIEIDSYGKCNNNRNLTEDLKANYLDLLYSPALFKFLSRYKFILSYENGICYDYITEKFWRPLLIGSVPIYFGSPTIKDWQPNGKSMISIADFESPKELAEFIRKVDNDDVEYNRYLNHKYNMLEPVSNEKLLNELKNRGASNKENIFAAFECFVCQSVHNKFWENGEKCEADVKHYECPLPPFYPKMKNVDHSWEATIDIYRPRAKVLDYMLQRNEPYTMVEMQKKFKEVSSQ